MKELSIEEKAKAYDGNYKTYTELINRLEGVKDAIKKQNYGIAMDILCKPYLEYQIIISTELKESEDERVRKVIADIVKAQPSDSLFNGTKEKCLAWLEKQGEQKSIDDLTQQEAMDIAVAKCFEQGEQKPSDKVEMSTFKDKLLELFQKFRWKSTPTNGDIIEYVDTHIQELINTIQKPAWSEEDMKMIEMLVAIFEVNYPDGSYKANPTGTTNMQCIRSSEIIKWLKSLKERYSWKPSDNELEVLRLAAEKDGACLMGLYEQLKKLRGE